MHLFTSFGSVNVAAMGWALEAILNAAVVG